MNCQQANQIDLVDYLASLGFRPEKIRRNDYWYLSPNRDENTASFKVNRSKNIWFDHGTGEGGNLVDFAMRYFSCELTDALEKIAAGKIELPNAVIREPGQLSTEHNNHIEIVRIDPMITDNHLLQYLSSRHIEKSVAQNHCRQILYENAGKRFLAIGFKNNCGGYELRSKHFKAASAPKYVTWFNNYANTITVFEGFFDFLTWRTINSLQQAKSTNILVLNSLSFFTRSLLLQEKHDRIHLYLDNDNPGRQCVQEILKRSPAKVIDESGIYKHCKDLNEWHVSQQNTHRISHSRKLGM
jgi:hypothetical protein